MKEQRRMDRLEPVTSNIAPGVCEWLKRRAALEGRSLSQVIRRILDDAFRARAVAAVRRARAHTI